MMALKRQPQPPTEEQHMMRTESAFSQWKEVATELRKICLPGRVEGPAGNVGATPAVLGNAVEDAGGAASRHGRVQIQLLADHSPSRVEAPLQRRQAAALWLSDSVGSGKIQWLWEWNSHSERTGV